MATLGELVVKIGADMRSLTGGLNDTTKQLNKWAKTAEKSVGPVMDKIGQAVLATGAAAVGFGAAAFAAANDVDKAMATIRAGTGATGEALVALKDDFKVVFGTVPQDAGTVSSALADLNTRTGLTGQALQSLTTQMLNLSRVSGNDVSVLVASTTRVFGDWSISTEKQADTLDYLWKVSQNTGIGVDTLAQKVVQFGAPLRQMGFDFETSAALMGKWEKEGVNLELVMGSLRQGLGKFARAGEEAPVAFRRVVEEIKNMESASQATALAMDIFGARAGPDMAAAIREGRFEIDELLATIIGSSETIKAAADETLTFGEAMQKLKNEATIALEPLGNVLLDNLKTKIQGIAETLSEWQKNGTLQEWADNATAAVNKFLSVAGPVFEGLIAAGKWIINHWGLISPILAGVLGGFLAYKTAIFVTEGLTAAQKALNLVMTANPYAKVILIAGALVTAGVALYQNWDTIKAKAGELWTAIETAWNNTKTKTEEIWGGIETFVDTTWDNLITWGTTKWQGFQKMFLDVWEAIKLGLKGYVNNIISMVNSVIRALNTIQVEIPDWVPGVGGNTFGINIPNVPMLAKGGIVTRPTLAVVGEKGPEAVIPLRGNNAPGSVTIHNINIHGNNSEEIWNKFRRELARAGVRIGG